jgi:tetratricopeptide (TPR) repeat protein
VAANDLIGINSNVNPSKSDAELYAVVLAQCLQSKAAWDEPIEVQVQGRVVSLPQGASAMFANDYNEMGLYLNNENRFREAIPWYDKALHARPRHVIAWFNKGVALAHLKDFRKAMECFDRALEIEPLYVDALYSKAGCAFELRQYRLAIDCYDKVIALNPTDLEAKRCRAETAKMLAK